MEPQQDVFISHAGHDKEQYIQALTAAFVEKGITFWLDNIEIGWGDSITRKINDGLARSRFVLLCLSRAFLLRPWPEAELGAALSIQNDTGVKRVLPLILNDKEAVLARFPLLADLSFREFSIGPTAIADEIRSLTGRPSPASGEIRIVVESVHTGHICSITASPRVSVAWLVDRAKAGMGLSDLADTGAYEPFHVRWVLVDARADAVWRMLPRASQRRLHAIVAKKDSPRKDSDLLFSLSERDRLDEIGIGDGVVFHMYAIEDEDRHPPCAIRTEGETGGNWGQVPPF